MGVKFYEPELEIDKRLNWIPDYKPSDIITVLMHQLFGSCDKERFGVKAAREKVESYKIELKERILEVSGTYGVRRETEELIGEFEKYST